MKKKMLYRKVLSVVSVLAGMFLFSFLLISLLALFVWKAEGNVRLVSAGLIVIYILVNVFGGFMMGKVFGKQKFFWGILTGGVFFSLLLLMGILFSGTGFLDSGRLFPGLMVCLVSGMIGGMLSPGTAVSR